MFSGKTTWLTNLHKQCTYCNMRVVVVNFAGDTRYAAAEAALLSTHDRTMIPCVMCSSIEELESNYMDEVSAAEVRVKTPEGFDLLPGNIDLTAAEIQLMDQSEREQRLKRALAPIRDEYDYILIDCPPALSLLTLNALAAADSVIVPMQCEYYALEGLSALVETIEALRANLNPALEIEGVLRTMFDVRNNLANAVSAELTEHFGEQVFRTIVPRNVRLAEAPSHGQSIVGYDRASRGGVAYLGLAGEIIRRNNQRKKADKAMETA
jgi:chromosome partitioning protein